jgi:hypothetical protein
MFSGKRSSRGEHHTHEVGQGLGLHLGHDLRAMVLDGSGARAEQIGDDLVAFSFDENPENLALARCQAGEFSLDVARRS